MLAVGARKALKVEQSKVGAKNICSDVVKGLGTYTAADDGLSGSASQASFAACDDKFQTKAKVPTFLG